MSQSIMTKELEEIKTQLAIIGRKGRHLRMLDTRDWDGYRELVTDEFIIEIQTGENTTVASGKENAVRQVQSSVQGLLTVHHAHTPEFDINSDEVNVIWAMHDRVVKQADQSSFSLYGYHHDRWVKQGGEWKLDWCRAVTHHLDVYPPQEAV